jgi:hypothetical protein
VFWHRLLIAHFQSGEILVRVAHKSVAATLVGDLFVPKAIGERRWRELDLRRRSDG